jgi:hypothetical protein
VRRKHGKRNEEKRDKIQQQIDKMRGDRRLFPRRTGSAKMGESMASVQPVNTRKVFSAFVSFRLQRHRDKFIELTDIHKFRLFRCCLDEKHKFYGRVPVVIEAPEPSDLLWENADVTPSERFRRSMESLLITVLILLCSMASLFFVQVFLAQNASTRETQCDEILWDGRYPKSNELYGTATHGAADCLAGVMPCTGSITDVSQVLNSTFLNISSTLVKKTREEGDAISSDDMVSFLRPNNDLGQLHDCECNELGLGAMSNGPVYNVCYKFMEKLLTEYGFLVFGASMTVIINLLLESILTFLTWYEKPDSITRFVNSKMSKIFNAQFFNIAILVLLLNAKSTIPIFFFLPGKFTDFSREWYSKVGASIYITMHVQAVVPHVKPIGVYYVKRCLARMNLKKGMTASEINSKLELPEFDMALRCSTIQVGIFCTTLYSAGIPSLLLVGAFNMTMAYWCDKFYLLNCCKKPPPYGPKIIQNMSRRLPLANLLHMVFAFFMFSMTGDQPDRIFRESATTGDDSYAAQLTAYTAVLDGGVGERIGRGIRFAFPSFMFILGVSCFFLYRVVIVTLVKTTLGACCKTCSAGVKVVKTNALHRVVDKAEDALFDSMGFSEAGSQNKRMSVAEEAGGGRVTVREKRKLEDATTFEEAQDIIANQNQLASYSIEHNPKYKLLVGLALDTKEFHEEFDQITQEGDEDEDSDDDQGASQGCTAWFGNFFGHCFRG